MLPVVQELDVLFEDAPLYGLRHGWPHVCHGAGLVAPTDMPSMSLARPEASRAGSRSALGEGAGMIDEGGGIQK